VIVFGCLATFSGFVAPAELAAQAVPNGAMTPQQALYLRALQMRGRGQVRTGYPQDIPLGQPGGGFVEPEQPQDTAHKNSSQKRIEARKTRDEQKRAARDEAQAKKAKTAKKPVKEAPAKAIKPPKKADADKDGK
jgi:hypothetical protein